MKNSFHKFEEIKAEAALKPCLESKIDFLEAWYDLAVTLMHAARDERKDSLFNYYANLSSFIGAYHKKIIKSNNPTATFSHGTGHPVQLTIIN
jgi:hypothetical protein